MQRKIVQRFALVLLGIVVIGTALLGISYLARARTDQRVALKGQNVPLIKNAQMLGSANAQQQLNLSIGLQLRNQEQLTKLLRAMYTPGTSQYRKFLTPQQFTAQYAPTQAEQQQVVQYLRQQGIQVTKVASNGLFINAVTDVKTVQAAFQTKVNNYQVGPRKFYANADPPTLPAEIASLITSIGGMDNSLRMRPIAKQGATQLATRQQVQKGIQPLAGYAPTDLRTAYNSAPLNQAGIEGSGQTVAVFELDGFQQSDIDTFLKNNNLGTPSITTQLVGGATNTPGAGAIEVELDIEIIAGMAPKASQVVYIGPNSTQGVNDTYNQIVTDNKTQVTSISWGLCESQSGTAELQALDNIFKQGSAQGMTFFAASGDSGAYDCNDSNLAVDSPSSDPYVTSVGGTALQTNGGAYGSESVWSSPTDTQRSPKGAGGGGGLSTYFAKPDWQAGPGVQNQYSNGKRQVPDVSANADPQTGYAVYCTVSASGCPATGNVVIGGTSAAAPLWAGSLALINEYQQKQGKARAGFVSPALYSLASNKQPYSPFHDVTSGTNLYYPATAGYDLGSGIGSPDVYNIARDLAGGTAPTPTPTPGETPTPEPTVGTTPTVEPTQPPQPTAQPTDTPVPPPSSGSLIQNGDFENGVDSWQESSAAGYELVDSKLPHAGTYGVYMCGYSSCNDVISQRFTIPSGATQLTVSYWWYGATNRTAKSCRDTFSVLLLDSAGNVIKELQQSCNADAKKQWKQSSIDVSSLLSSYAGQSVTLVFSARTTATKQTSAFFIDDVNVG